jgi:two-component system sensor histidine kinase UhpB
MQAVSANSNLAKQPIRVPSVRTEILLVLLYLVFAGLWVMFSDQAIEWLASGAKNLPWIQALKGLVFIGPTALLLHVLLRRSFRQLETAVDVARNASERFELVARASNDAIWDWNLITDELWWSEGFQNLFGYPKHELEPDIKSWTTRLHEEDRERTLAGIHKVIESGETTWSDEYRFRRRDGTFAIVYDRGFVIHDGNGKPIRMVGGMMDVTARKQAEEQLELSRRQMRALTARLESLREEERTRISREIHDELGQMLTGLKMDLRWAEKKLSNMEEQTELNPILDKIVDASELTDQTINCVQRIAMELRPGVLDHLGLPTAIKYEAKRFEDRSGVNCNIYLSDLSIELKPNVSTIIFRILQEALTNAARHAHATKVDIDLYEQAGEIVLQIRDDGKGISTDDVDSPRSLGLVGMKERASLLQGSITFQRAPTGGTMVTLKVPRSANDTSFWDLV